MWNPLLAQRAEITGGQPMDLLPRALGAQHLIDLPHEVQILLGVHAPLQSSEAKDAIRGPEFLTRDCIGTHPCGDVLLAPWGGIVVVGLVK